MHCRAFAAMTRKGSFTVTYHTLTVTVVRISNLYQACYRCVLPGKTAQTFHRELASCSCSWKRKVQCSSPTTDIRPVPTNPGCSVAAAMGSYQMLPKGRMGFWRLD